MFGRSEEWGLEKRNLLIEYRQVAGNVNVEGRNKWQPQQIVGEACAHAASGGRMPPMLHVTLFKLMTSGDQNLFASNGGVAVNKGHHVLQLIAETKSAS